MSGLAILDLCGGTGAWSQPYFENGYKVTVVDPLAGEYQCGPRGGSSDCQQQGEIK